MLFTANQVNLKEASKSLPTPYRGLLGGDGSDHVIQASSNTSKNPFFSQ